MQRFIPLILAVACSIQLNASAIDSSPSDSQSHRGSKKAALDTDGDGLLSENEIDAAAAALRERLNNRNERVLRRFDKDGDGQLSSDEQSAAAEAKQRRQHRGQHRKHGAFGKRMFERMDQNGDFLIDDAELDRGLSELEGRLAERNAAGPLARFDQDGDGQLNDAEQTALREAFTAMGRADKADELIERLQSGNIQPEIDAVRDRIAARVNEYNNRMLKRFDTNNDGKIDDDERAAAQAERPHERHRHLGNLDGSSQEF